MALCAPDRLLGLLLWSTLRVHSRTWLLHRGNATVLPRYSDCPLCGMQGGAMYLGSSTASISGASFTSCSAVSVDSIQLFTIGAKPGVADRCHHNRFPATASQSHDTYDTLTCGDTWALAPHPHSHPTHTHTHTHTPRRHGRTTDLLDHSIRPGSDVTIRCDPTAPPMDFGRPTGDPLLAAQRIGSDPPTRLGWTSHLRPPLLPVVVPPSCRPSP